MSTITLKKTVIIPLLPIAFVASVVLLVLKATGTIAMSWWVVFSPILAVLAISGGIILLALLIMGLCLLMMAVFDRD